MLICQWKLNTGYEVVCVLTPERRAEIKRQLHFSVRARCAADQITLGISQYARAVRRSEQIWQFSIRARRTKLKRYLALSSMRAALGYYKTTKKNLVCNFNGYCHLKISMSYCMISYSCNMKKEATCCLIFFSGLSIDIPHFILHD